MTPGLSTAIIVMVLIAAGIFFYANLLRTLRWKHRRIHENLGRPKLASLSPDDVLRVMRFVFSKQPKITRDPELISTTRALRFFVVLLLFVFVAGVTYFVLKTMGKV